MKGTFEFVGVRFFLMPYFAPLICPRCISPSKQFTPHPLSPRNIVCTVFPWYPNQVNITIFDVSETKRGRRTMSLREISPKKGCLAALLLGLGHEKKKTEACLLPFSWWRRWWELASYVFFSAQKTHLKGAEEQDVIKTGENISSDKCWDMHDFSGDGMLKEPPELVTEKTCR